jgi:hypothetical protein
MDYYNIFQNCIIYLKNIANLFNCKNHNLLYKPNKYDDDSDSFDYDDYEDYETIILNESENLII